MSLLRDPGGTRPTRGPLVGTVLSILFHVLVLIAVLTLAPRLGGLVSLDTADHNAGSDRTMQPDQPVAAPEDADATRLTLLGRWLRRAWAALASTIEIGAQEHDAAIGFGGVESDADRLARMDPDPLEGHAIVQRRLETGFHARVPQAAPSA